MRPNPSEVRPARVVLDHPDQASLLGLLMRRMLAARASDPRAAKMIGRMDGDVRITAGEMTVGLRFEPACIRIVDGSAAPRAWVKGDVATLLQLVSGRFDLRRLLAGRLRAGGDPRMLLRLWALLRAGANEEAS